MVGQALTSLSGQLFFSTLSGSVAEQLGHGGGRREVSPQLWSLPSRLEETTLSTREAFTCL